MQQLLFTLTFLLILLLDSEKAIIAGATHTSSSYMLEVISQQLLCRRALDAVEDLKLHFVVISEAIRTHSN